MTVSYEIDDLRDFKAWSGAVKTIKRAYDLDAVDYLNNIMNDIFYDGCTETELNDWLWFDADDYLDEFEEENREDDEEDENDE